MATRKMQSYRLDENTTKLIDKLTVYFNDNNELSKISKADVVSYAIKMLSDSYDIKK